MNKLKNILFIILFISIYNTALSQTVIALAFPSDATAVLQVVNSKDSADIIVYKTESKDEANEWDCKWKFKKWGFANISIYLTESINDTLLYDYYTEKKNRY